MGLGIAAPDTLSRVRRQAMEARELAKEGIDPIAHRTAERLRRVTESAQTMTFKECAEKFVDAHKDGWRNAKHTAQWTSTLEAYAYPVFGDVPVHLVDVTLVKKALDPIWKTKTETASRVRQRIEAVLNQAKALGLRQGENPAQWRGHLDKLLPPRNKVQRVQHHAAMSYSNVPTFVASLSEYGSTASKALRLLILTATRTSEVLNAKWEEMDLDGKTWRIPPERMKAGREHRVPLSPEAVEILRSLEEQGSAHGWIFAGAKKGRPLSNMALLKLMARVGHADLTVHGFRSSFRDWAAEQTNFPREVAEAALAHVVSDKVEAAYRRSDLFEKRRLLLEEWSRFCASLITIPAHRHLSTPGAAQPEPESGHGVLS